MKPSGYVGLAMVGATVLLAGCEVGRPAGETKTVTKSVDIAKVKLEMTAGDLKVDGGSAKLMDGSFRFNVPEWEPSVQYADEGSHGSLTVKQPGPSSSTGNTENKWDVRLNDGVAIDLSATLGAGDATLTLGTMNLQHVDVKEGAGDLTVDLRGAPKRSYDVTVKSGTGDTKIHLPRSVGIVATAAGAVGDIHVNGLEKRGDRWVNPNHEGDAVVVHVDVKGAVGDITISTE